MVKTFLTRKWTIDPNVREPTWVKVHRQEKILEHLVPA